MILVMHRSSTVRARALEACTRAGRLALGLESVNALRECVRLNRPAVVVTDSDGADDKGRSLLLELRSEPRMAGVPIIWLEERQQRNMHSSSEDEMVAEPDAWMSKGEIDGRLEMEIRRLTADDTETQQVISEPSSVLQTPKVLVIDDSLTYRMELRQGLLATGYDVVLAETGEAGLEIAFREPLSAVIVDNVLPGMQGSTVIRRLRSEAATRRIPCLLLTASGEANTEVEALEAGADSFVRKDEVIETILLRLKAIVRNVSEPAAMEFAPASVRRVSLMGEGFPDGYTLRAALMADGLVVVQESNPERIFRNADVVFADAMVLAVPHAMAVDLCQRIKSTPHLAKTRLLVMEFPPAASKTVLAERQAAMLQAGADDYLPASLPVNTVRARLETQMRRKQMEDENRALHDHLLRQRVEAESQRKLAAARATHADEMRVAKDAVEVEAKQAEEARLQLERVMEGLPQIILVASAQAELLAYNHRWVEYTGSEPPATTPEMWNEVLAPEDVERHKADRSYGMEVGTGYAGEYRLRSASGAYRWFYVHAIPMYSDHEQLREAQEKDPHGAHWLATLTDIHDRKLAEEALRRNEKLAATGRLAASIAHEINNPLEAVTNLLFLLEHGTQADEESHGYVVMAQQEVARVSEIAKKTLAFYRESKSAAPVDMKALVWETRDVYASRLRIKEIELLVDIRTELQPIGLSGELRQIVSNLMANAVDASSPGSPVCVRVHASTQWSTGRKGVRLLVWDRGAGIPEYVQREIFRPFVTTKGANGTGLGLWVAVSIAARHQGELRFRSSQRPGRNGTCFSLFLPLDGNVAIAEDSIGEMMKQIGSELLER